MFVFRIIIYLAVALLLAWGAWTGLHQFTFAEFLKVLSKIGGVVLAWLLLFILWQFAQLLRAVAGYWRARRDQVAVKHQSE